MRKFGGGWERVCLVVLALSLSSFAGIYRGGKATVKDSARVSGKVLKHSKKDSAKVSRKSYQVAKAILY